MVLVYHYYEPGMVWKDKDFCHSVATTKIDLFDTEHVKIKLKLLFLVHIIQNAIG